MRTEKFKNMWKWNKIIYAKPLGQCLEYSKHSIHLLENETEHCYIDLEMEKQCEVNNLSYLGTMWKYVIDFQMIYTILILKSK